MDRDENIYTTSTGKQQSLNDYLSSGQILGGIDARPARLFNLSGFLNVARIVNRVQAGECSLPVARRFQGDVAIYQIEKRDHFRNRLDDVIIAIEHTDIFCYLAPTFVIF